MTKMIIATDMALHFEYINKFKTLMEEKDPDFDKEENKTFVMSMWVHVADLTNPAKEWDESYKWALLVYEEFFVQGDKEKELGLPVGDLNDRQNINLAKSQLGFMDFIIKPTLETFELLLPKISKNIKQLKENRERWSNMIPEWDRMKEEGNYLMDKFREADDPGNRSSESFTENKRTADAPRK